MVVLLRQVAGQDAARLAVLLGQLGYPTDEPAVRDRLRHWFDDPASVLIGADDGGELVGVAAVHVMPMLEVTGKLARLLALVVDDGSRGRGVGRSLVAEAERWAGAAGAVRMEISSSRHRVRAHEFYEGLGYEDRCAVAARFQKVL